jgi:hypothetical protein
LLEAADGQGTALAEHLQGSEHTELDQRRPPSTTRKP